MNMMKTSSISVHHHHHMTTPNALPSTQANLHHFLCPTTLLRKPTFIPLTVTACAKRPTNKTNNKPPPSSSGTGKSTAKSYKPKTKQWSTTASRSVRLAAVEEVQKSPDFLSALDRSGDILQVAELNIMLRNLGSSSRWSDLSQLFEWMQRHGKINFASYSSYIKFLAVRGDTLKALSTYEAINDATMRNNISVCNSVLSCLVKNCNFSKALDLFQQMKQNGLQPDAVTYSTLLAGCIKLRHGYEKALELVEELGTYKIMLDSVLYGTLIAVCASNSQCGEAEKYYICMKAEGHSPNMYHYSALVNAYSAVGDYPKANALIEDMRSAGLVPNKVVLTALLKVYVRGGLIKESRSLLSELESLGYAGDEMPYCILMDGFSKSGKVDEAKAVFDEMNRKHVRSDGYAHNIMISAFCSIGKMEEAKKLANEYEILFDKYDLIILNVMLCAHCRAGDMEGVMQMMRKMDKLAISPDENTFCILIKYFWREKLYVLAYRSLQDMHSKGYQLEEETLSFLIQQLGRDGVPSEAYAFYKILRSSEVAISKTVLEKILNVLIAGQRLKDAYMVVKDNAKVISKRSAKRFLIAFLKSGNLDLINGALEAVHLAGHELDQNLFHLAISRYVEQPQRKELLLHLMQWMPNHGYVVDSSTRNLILKNSDLYGSQFIADLLSKQHAVLKT